MRWRGTRAGRGRRNWLAAVALMGGSVFVTQAEDIELNQLLPLWDHAFNVRTAVGYRDNITLSGVNPIQSGFVTVGLDASVWRLPEGGREFQFSLSADDLRYFSNNSAAAPEQVVLAQATFKQDIGPRWQASISLEYLYQDQVLDVSTSEVDLNTIRVQGQTLQGTPGMRLFFLDGSWIELAVPVQRGWFAAPLDSFWQGGPRLTLARPSGDNSEWATSVSFNQRSYDHRPQVALDGSEIPGTHLAFQQLALDLSWRHSFDEENHWRTKARLGLMENTDNGSGFFNYVEFYGAVSLTYRDKTWEVGGQFRLGYYGYTLQMATPTALRNRTEAIFNLRGEKRLARWVKLYADFQHESNLSNDALDEYSVNTVSAGFLWEF